jgi:hypothetical protein
MTPADLQLRRMGYLQQVIALADQDPAIAEFLHDQIHEILVYARLQGHEVSDWSDNETYN